MRYLPLILLFIIPALSNAQVTTSLQDGGLFYVVVEGDTVSQHVRVDKAVESASNYRDWEIVQDFRLSGSSLFYGEDIIIEEVTDTIYADTVYVNLPPHDNSFLHSVDWTHEVDRETGEERIDFVIKTDEVDSLIIEVRCGNEWVKETVFPDAENDISRPANTLYYGILWDCDSDLIYHFRAHKGVWEQAITERFPAFAFELTESEQALIDSVKKKDENDMSLYWTDFSEYQSGFEPDDWTRRFSKDFSWNIEDDIEAFGGKFIKGIDENSNSRNGLSWDKIDSDQNRGDVEVVARVRFPLGVSNSEILLMSRGNFDNNSDSDLYRHGLRPSFNNIELAKYVNGNYDAIVSTSFNIGSNVWYWIRSRVNGGDHYVKAWEDGTTEPNGWNLEAFDASVTDPGWVGLLRFRSDPVDIDIFSVATGGDTAPMEDPNAGEYSVEGDASIIENPEQMIAGGVIEVGASSNLIDNPELADLSGNLLLSGDSELNDEPEVAQSTATIYISGSGSVFDLMDQVDSAGAVLIESTATVDESPEQIKITGAFEDVIEASAQIMDMAEQVGGSASVVISGSGQVDENSEAVQAHSEIIISSAGDLTDHPEAMDGQMVLLISSSGSISELQDEMNAQLAVSLSGSAELFGIPEQLQGFATFEEVITAAAQIVEHAEVMGGNASIMISGNAEAHELPENVVIDSSLYLAAGAAMDEDPEAISVLSKIAIDMAASITEKPEQLLSVETVISDRVKIRVTGQRVGNDILITGDRVPSMAILSATAIKNTIIL